MKPFLKEIAEEAAKYKDLQTYTFVFPNRRASLFFQHYLSLSLEKPSWAPRLISIEDFFSSLTDLAEPDRLTLIFRLYKIYGEVMNSAEPFDRFYFWGDMLLRDFDEIDKYMVNAPVLFKDLSKLKELDTTFDFLTDEQKEFLKGFWINFEDKPAASKDEFLRVWRKLPKVYSEFTKALKKEKLGYEGMIHKDVADKLGKSIPKSISPDKIVFAGFNALTRAEEMIISFFVERGATVHWDCDDYYLENESQEAGQFFRQYRRHPVLGKTFGKPSSSFKEDKEVHLTGVPQRIGQAKLTGQALQEMLREGFDSRKTVVVLPDESMLLPVLQSLPPHLDDVNVTMGFSLRNTPLYNLLDLMLDMQLFRRGDAFSHRQVAAILGHAYISSLAHDDALEFRTTIIKNNRVFIPAEELQKANDLFKQIFQITEPDQASSYLLAVTQTLGASFTDKQSFDREYAYHFHRHLSRLHEVLHDAQSHPDWRGFQKLFRQIVISQRIPFTGEPLKGLQVMGVLETRNLDFENVFVLSLNEGMLPAASRQGSYIPHSIRRAYQLPTHDHQDAMYAYLFYRLLQRAKTVRLYYNTEPDVIGNGEMSRFAQQLIYESGLPILHYIMHNEIQVNSFNEVTVKKDAAAWEALKKYRTDAPENVRRELTPSALNDYIDCRLRFYLKHIAKMRESMEVEEDFDARTFGNLLHDLVHRFYETLAKKNNGDISRQDLEKSVVEIDGLIAQALITLYHLDPDKPVKYEGQRVVVREIAREFINKIIEHDLDHTPFRIVDLEAKFFVEFKTETAAVNLGGKIDRVDQKGNTVRIIDYKTGKDELGVESIASLFNRVGKRNKAAFQTMLYAYIYKESAGNATLSVIPGLMNRKNLFDSSFNFGHPLGKSRSSKELMASNATDFSEFEENLSMVMRELFDSDHPFTQTEDIKTCTYCPYKSICRR